jgi:serine protease Do
VEPSSDDDLPPQPNRPQASEPETPDDADAQPAARRTSQRDLISRNGLVLRETFRPVVDAARRSTVSVFSGNRQIALGAIVDPSGLVVTKNSELEGPLECQLADGTRLAATVYGISESSDLALLKIDASSLPIVDWKDASDLAVGSWVVSPNVDDVLLGVVSTPTRQIKPSNGFMGVLLAEHDPGVRITGVTDDLPAERAGLRAGDVIVRVDGEVVDDRPELQDKIRGYRPGDRVKLTILRDDAELTLQIELADRQQADPNFRRSNLQNTMGGRLSGRRTDFPMAIQHDTVLEPAECGGPICDLTGRVIGLNIARSGRVSSLALPTAAVLPIIEQLKSGELAPAIVNKDRIAEISRLLDQLNLTIATAPDEATELEQELAELSTAEAEARAKLDEAMKALSDSTEAKLRIQLQLEQRRADLEQAQREKDQLERQRQKLVTGS